jgi:hypothetical protein
MPSGDFSFLVQIVDRSLASSPWSSVYVLCRHVINAIYHLTVIFHTLFHTVMDTTYRYF